MRVILSAFFSLCFVTAFGQVTSSLNDGNWEDSGTWDCVCVPEEWMQVIVAHDVTVTTGGIGNEIVVASGAALTIDEGAVLTISDNFTSPALTIENGGQVTNNGTLDLSGLFVSTVIVDGILENFSTVAAPESYLFYFNSGSVYRHGHLSGGDIPIATWDINSTCEIAGLDQESNPLPPNNLNQDFGNFVWNTPDMGTVNTAFHLGGQLNTVRGNLHFLNLNNRQVRLAGTGGSGYQLNVGGNLSLDNGTVMLTLSQTSDTEVTVAGNYIQTNGGVVMAAGPNGSAVTFTVGGDFLKSAGTFTPGAGTGAKNIVFNGDGTPQVYSVNTVPSNSLPASGSLHFRVAGGAHLDIGVSPLVTTGTGGSFTLEGGATLSVGSLDDGGAIQDNIRITNKTFDPGSTIIYDGAGPQFISVTTGGSVNTIINNANGVTLVDDVTIGGNLTLTAGNLSVGAHELTLGGTTTANGNSIIVDPGSSIVVEGSGAFGTFPFPAGPQTFTNFTLSRNGGTVSFADDVTLTGSLTLQQGTLDITGTTLTLNGPINRTGGLFASTSDESSLIIDGSGTIDGNLTFNSSANVLGTLTLNRESSTITLNSNLVIQNELNLLDGTFTNTTGLNLGDGAIITRMPEGSYTGNAPANAPNERYSIVYTGGTEITTGAELPASGVDLLNLTIDAPVTLDKSITINGDLTLLNSTLTATTNITMAGQPGTMSFEGGNIDLGSGVVVIAGDITIESPNATPQFFSLTTEEQSTLTIPNSISIGGNLQLHSNSTFDANGGTIELNGSGNQQVSGSSKDFNNITVSKPSGQVQFISNVRLNGILNVASATEVKADGNLTVVSLSDGTSGNGSIGTLADGASVTGDVTVQRFMSEEGRIWRYISSPVTNATVAQLQDDFYITGNFTNADTDCEGCTSNPSMFYYEESTPGISQEGYFQFPVSSNTETLEPGRGYSAFIRDNIIPGPVTIDVTGPINQGDIGLPVSFTDTDNAGHDGYNLVGNPFPSTINWSAAGAWERNNIAFTIAVRDNGGGGGLLYWDGSTGGLPNGNIATGQAFWVRATGGSPVLIVKEDAKVSATGAFFRERQEPVDVLQIVLSNDTFTDRAFFRYRPEATGNLDDYDAPKLNNDLFDIATLSDDDLPMAINATNTLPCGNTIRLHMKDLEPGSYTLSTEASGVFLGVNTRLVDNFTNNTIDFSTTPQYAFSVTNDPQSNVADRFSIILEDTPIDPNSVTPSLADECEVENYQITLQGAQKGIYYFAEIAGNIVGDSVLADGSETITLSVPTSELTIGSNEVVLRGYNYCTTVPIAADLTINHDQIYAVTSNDVTDCADAQVTLEASGAPANGSYNWYEEEASEAPIEGQHASIFTTPALPKSKTYYVAAVNARGCEGPRVPVKAKVVPFDPVEITEAEPGQFVSSYAEGNQWYWDGNVIEGATSNTYTATKSGTYTVEVNLEGCITSASADFLVTGIDEFAADRMLSPYENPFRNVLRIHVNSTTPVEQMSVFNTMGSKVGDLSLTRSGNVTEGVIDMTSSTSGMYLVKTLLEGRVYTIKVIKK